MSANDNIVTIPVTHKRGKTVPSVDDIMKARLEAHSNQFGMITDDVMCFLEEHLRRCGISDFSESDTDMHNFYLVSETIRALLLGLYGYEHSLHKIANITITLDNNADAGYTWTDPKYHED